MSQKFLFDYASLPYGTNGNDSDWNRMNWRCELLLTRNKELIKGS
ncbi:hypothetical protein [Aphanothece sacrum]|nr:hypothetical protein [Aphanothece sacrum]